ncbi:MAG: tetratricopeptide repeat protein [Verrucomicrobia bacterium]|nr:tetratricopeptide repeat protein [Verrucomicrobiota bacterium]MDA1005319.1 tetratricopeptide repeat protein [Verrucomicrobiota bacterium]
MRSLKSIILILALAIPLTAAPADEAVALEAKLKETAESSPGGAALMLQLIDLYWADEQVFGLIRTASKFSRAQPEHPRRAEIMLKLMDGYAVTSRHEDVITTGRQFLELFPGNPLTNPARHRLATAIERTGRGSQAATQRGEIWRNGGATADGLRSLQLSMLANNGGAFKEATTLATEMVEKLPVDVTLTAVGFQGMEAAERTEQWTEGLQLAKALLRRQAPFNELRQRDLWYRSGRFESHLGQHENAVESFRKALTPGRDDIHRALIQAMSSAAKPPADIEAEARRYLAAFPQRDDRYDQLAQAAGAAAQAKDTARGLAIAEEVMRANPNLGDLARSYVQWCGDDHKRAEQGLLKLIGGNPPGVATLRAVLALDVYRDRLKDDGKARAIAQKFLADSPTENGWVDEITAYLYDSASNETAFAKDLAAVTASAKAFPHLAGFQDRVWNRGPQDKTRQRTWQEARRNHLNDGTTKLWKQTLEDGGRSGQACQQLLQQTLNTEQRHQVLARLAYVYRHHLGGKSKEVSGTHYETLCKAFPQDLDAASRWLDAAAYGPPEMKLAAANHLLTIPPGPAHYDTWWRLIEPKDEALVRKAIPWITASAKQSSESLAHATRIGDVMNELGMKAEALAWWKAHMDLDPNNHECASCARRVASTMEPAAARAFLLSRFEADTDHQGTYAGEIAALDFAAGNFEAMETILKQSRARADQDPFRPWKLGEWPVRTWIETARGEKEWPDEKKARVFQIVRDLRLGRVSAEAGMELLGTTKRSLDRLLQAQDFLLMAESHYESWNRLFPYAQGALAREDLSLATTILNGLLNTIRSVGNNEMTEARSLLRNAYGKMGSLSADIPADSPIAPLLEIILHLRLGENTLAEEAYYTNKALFDAHREDLPVELILFGAQTHIDQGTPQDHERAEDILRGWMLKFSESDKVDIREKARVQLLLARNYQRARQFDIARAEFTTVLNIYKDQPESVDARFGIGETYMAQKVYDQAADIFADLAESTDPSISIRADFLSGVLAIRQDNNQEARAIFLSVLEHAPDAELANETLYNLAEVYGIEQRYLTQLETLRTVGRLGQESKVWHTPGNALSVVVLDPDLGISRGDTRIPVVVRTEPGGDLEQGFLTSGGAGKGIFLTEFPTTLGGAKPGDGILQVTGGDTITVDYPEDFKKQFQFEFLSNTRIRIASDGDLQVASSEIINEDDATFTETLKQEVAETEEEQPRAATRPQNQIKPGNLIYIQVKDGDRDLTGEADPVGIKLTASSGDEVQMQIEEASQHGGLFLGMARTGELPAGASASDSALDHSPLMAIDHSLDTAWRSEPDGAAPKSLSVDMKELRPTEMITLTSPQAEQEAPVRLQVCGSHDGRFWFNLAAFPTPEPPAKLALPGEGMQLRVYKTEAKNLRETYTWQEIAELTAKVEATETSTVETLSWQAPEEGEDAYFLVWSGPFVQERNGAVRFDVAGRSTAVLFDGRLELPVGESGRQVDVFATRGIHDLTIFSIATPQVKLAQALRARENRQSSAISLHPFAAADFDPTTAPDLAKVVPAPLGEIKQETNQWTLTMPSRELRYIDFDILEYRGEAVAINNVEISGGGAKHIPPAENVLELASNDILELAPGDTVLVSYLDELTAGGEQSNRLLTKSLTATYYNGGITPIGYDFARSGSGSVDGTRKELLRIEPGDRIVAEVVDFDLDVGLEKDSVEVEVQINADPPFTLPATETGSSTGVFLAEIETSATPVDGKVVVKQGDKVYLRYKDTQNTFPGHAFHRETVVFLNEPTAARIQIVDSETPVDAPPHFLPGAFAKDHTSKVEYRLPLTVEVIDPDQARDSRSTITVEIATSQGTNVQVQCVLSRALATPDETLEEFRNPALLEGRFVGQVPLLLGDPQSATAVPADGTFARASIGKVLPPVIVDPAALLDDGSPKTAAGVFVLNTLGNDTFTASYEDQSRPDGTAAPLEATAALASAASLEITDEEYLEPAEIAHVGKKLFLVLADPDRDISSGRDKALVRLVTASGEDETIELEETLTHSGVFSASFPLVASQSPTSGNFAGNIECFFGDEITVGYLDNVPQTPDGEPIIERLIPVAIGTNGEMSAFSKVYKDEDLAIQTQFHIAESYFELFKSHRALEHLEEAEADLQSGRRVLRELREDYPNPKYAPRVSYLLGQFAQEMKAWDEAIAAYGSIVRNHPDHNLAPDAQYKLGQCHEEAGELDEALEAYVTLAGTYPKSPLIANVMLRINEHFYTKEDYATAASVGAKFLEKFPNHEWTPKMAFRIGQCHYKLEEFQKGGEAFDAFVKRFPEQELTAQALFWAGESYRMGNDIPNAFRRYNRCRWDFPESDAAKYSRGRLALPELLAQFEREANLDE